MISLVESCMSTGLLRLQTKQIWTGLGNYEQGWAAAAVEGWALLPIPPNSFIIFFLKGRRRIRAKQMSEDTRQDIENDRRKKWALTYKTRMIHIVPGLLLGNVEASHNQTMLEENGVSAIVSLTSAR